MTRVSNQPLRIAMVGAGRMAQQHVQALRHVRVASQLVAVCDTSEPAARALAGPHGARLFSECAAMMRDARPDIVHVVTPAGRHFDAAHAALSGGAHVYVEKPFVETSSEADALLTVAARAGRLVCTGHQQLFDPAYRQVMGRASTLAPVHLIDGHFTFRPPTLRLERSGDVPLAEQLIDILPHPLYTLLDAVQRLGSAPPQLQAVRARATDLTVTCAAGDVTARLFVSLAARPIASTLTVSGAGGALTADFVRSMVIGAGNPGTSPIEKILNPILEGWQQQIRTMRSVGRRLVRGGYPGLTELIDAFYTSVRDEQPSPVTPEHIRLVTATYERLASQIRQAVAPRTASASVGSRPVALLTGARGFLGGAIARALTRRGYRVRGTARSHPPAVADVHDWVVADLSRGLPDPALEGVDVVVHAAAETGGGFDEHQRNSIDATRQLLAAMKRRGLRRLVYVSSLSVLEPPRRWRERQHEATPLARDAQRLGPYAWGKTIAERLVTEATGADLESRIIRPGALFDAQHPELPGLAGRRLFGAWHLGLGRPGLPIAVCDVDRAAEAIAWCAAEFRDAPPVVNLSDDRIASRADLIQHFRRHGWRGRVLWVPIPLIAFLFMSVRTVLAWAKGRRPTPLAPWDILRPRWYNAGASRELLTRAGPGATPAGASSPPAVPAAV